jgi:CubicO group peptidase (beta-lactamase class C family)/peptidoglycan/LPS O-acetylase OafA/YrhL
MTTSVLESSPASDSEPALDTTVSSDIAPPKQAKARDGFLDTVRAIALIRVIIWHTLAFAAISWVVAAMPAMFFVAGSLLERSMQNRPWRPLLTARLKRLLLPFWTLGAVVLSVLALVNHLNPGTATALSPMSLLGWIFPLVDPRGTVWEAGWASTPLWYIRCYLWLLLLSPLLRRAHLRWGLRALIVPVVAVFGVDFLIRNPDLAPAAFGSVKYYLGDLAAFSFFWMLGFSHNDGVIASLSRAARLEWAAIGGVAAIVWVQFIAPPTLVVNDSYPLLLFVGIAWLGLFLAAETWIGKATTYRWTAPIIRWLGRRSISVYLWHPIAIVGSYWLLTKLMPSAPRVAVLPIVFFLTIVLAVLFGRVEDHAAGRPAQWWPGRDDPRIIRRAGDLVGRLLPRRLSPVRALLIGAVVGLVIVTVLIPAPTGSEVEASTAPAETTGGLALPPAPSAKPDQANFGAATTAASTAVPASAGGTSPAAAAASPVAGSGTAIDPAAAKQRLQTAVDGWRTTKVVDGVELGVRLADGSDLTLTSGKAADGSAWDLSGAFPITSITKSMTAAITLELIKEGKIGLDDPLPVITKVPDLPYAGKVTIHQLLDHTAGVQPYDKTPGYAALRTGPFTPETALALVVPQPLEWAPGTQVGYSNSGYLTLGLLDEQLTGQSYADLLQARIFDPVGMTNSHLDDTPAAGWVGFSAGGVVSTVADQLAYGDALYRSGKILDAGSLALMLNVDNQFSTGLGAFPTCPCSLVNGVKVYSSIGHNGGQATVQYAPAQHIIVALNISESMWTADLSQADVAELLTSMEQAVAGP